MTEKPELSLSDPVLFPEPPVSLEEESQLVVTLRNFHGRVNGVFISANHWKQDLAPGGGRMLGEARHFIDLLMMSQLQINDPRKATL